MKKATHRAMYAYRTETSSSHCDGGESGAGDRLARLIEHNPSWDHIVVVTRWYGGVPLGSMRWKRISEVAKQALSLGGFDRPCDPK